MKKFLQFVIAMVVSLCWISNVNAASKQDLIDYVSKNVSNPEATAIVKSYLADNDIDASVADQVIANADKIMAIMKEENVTDPTKLSKSAKDKVSEYANTISSLTGATFNYNSTTKAITITGPNGKVYGSLSVTNEKKLANTGANYTVYVAISGLALILVISTVALYRKSKGNA